MKKKVQLLFLLCICVVLIAAPVKANPTNVLTSDVVDIDDHWAVDQMTHLVAMGIVKGYDTTYYDPLEGQYVKGKALKPETRITRAEFAVMMYQALNLSKSNTKAPFKDAKNIPGWAQDAVNTLYAQGIMLGDAKGYVYPNGNIRRSEIAAMIVKAINDKSEVKQYKNFPDVKTGDWFYQPVQKAADMGIIMGKPNGAFAPNDFAKRGEVITMLFNMMARDKVKVPGDNTLLAVADGYMNRNDQIFKGGPPYDLSSLAPFLTGSQAAALPVDTQALNALSEVVEIKYEVLSDGKVVSKSDWLAEINYDTRLIFKGSTGESKSDLIERVYLMKVNNQWLIYYVPAEEVKR